MDETALKVLSRTVETLDKLDIPYVIGGSFASSFHGLPRATNDVDIVALIKEQQIQLLVAEYENDFHIDEEMVKRALRQTSSFNLIHFDTSFKVDVFIAKSDFQKQEIERRQLKKLGSESNYCFYFSTPEDIVLAKLDWYRKGNCLAAQQWSDISNVIRIQGERLDIEYLRYWASELQLGDLLEQALKDSLID
jgi:hypothetical protein